VQLKKVKTAPKADAITPLGVVDKPSVCGALHINDMETWVDVGIAKGRYKVSSYGRVMGLKGQILVPHKDKDGYMRLHIRAEKGIKKFVGVHRLVAMNFIPNPQDKKEVNHIDFNRSNNYIDNLEWVTRKENAVHSRERYGVRGEDNSRAKVTNKQALRMRELRKHGLLYREIAKIYNLNYTTAVAIVKKGYKTRYKNNVRIKVI
jgi:hypothetical protein